MVCGSRILSTIHIANIFKKFRYDLLYGKDDYAFVSPMLETPAFKIFGYVEEWRPTLPIPPWLDDDEYNEEEHLLLSLLEDFKDWEATDLRDSVYALAGLAQSSETIQPDYLLSTKQIYKKQMMSVMYSVSWQAHEVDRLEEALQEAFQLDSLDPEVLEIYLHGSWCFSDPGTHDVMQRRQQRRDSYFEYIRSIGISSSSLWT